MWDSIRHYNWVALLAAAAACWLLVPPKRTQVCEGYES
jgi:hypothetical protein